MRFSPPDLTEIEGSLLSLDHQRGETVVDCAWIWVRSEIRDPPEALTRRCRPRLCSSYSPHSKYSFHGVPQRMVSSHFLLSSSSTRRTTLDVDVSRGKSDAFFHRQVTCFKEFCAPSVLHFPFQSSRSIAICNPAVSAASSRNEGPKRLTALDRDLHLQWSELRGVSQALPSMPARNHFGEARSISPSGYSLALRFKPVEHEALWYGCSKCCLCASM
ncbi:LOW QUALITY PROTEIN: hypothetical protein HID58_070523 [Brassica napus]|uniref:Uncharacterized protein n=1 Tax=Brassica napus TaxID=3708 RepID=A0ABQ7YZ11_BRANA|nr:LOW QUALITY PROTEIN: hypothetical protein HID58_070523 [Brassica napus]